MRAVDSPKSPNGALRASQAVSGAGVFSDNRMAKPIPGNFPNDFGKI